MSRSPCSPLVFIAALAASMLACTDKQPAPEPEEIFTVRLLTSAALSGRWERAAEQGIGRVAAELDARVSRVRCAADELSEAVAASGEQEPVDLVFCVGPGFESFTFTEAAAHPDVRFVLLPGRGSAANVAGIDFVVDGGGYVAGAVAAAIADEPVAGVIRGQGRKWLEDVEEGFVAGFSAARRRGVVHTASGADAPWILGREGVRVALYAADSPDAAVLAAAHNAGVVLIAVDPELMRAEPDLVVASLELDIPEAMVRVAREATDESFSGGVYAFGLGSGVVNLRLNPVHEMASRPAVVRSLEAARTEVTAGLVEIERLGI